jgi:hypothetical protein
MTQAEFDTFYQKSIVRNAKKICDLYKKAGIVLGFQEIDSRSLHDAYINQRNGLKNLVGSNKGDAHRLDRHKVAACMTCAIIAANLLYAEDNPEMHESSIHSAGRYNEQLGFLCGLEVLVMYLLADGAFKNIEEIREKFQIIYPTAINGDSYLDSTVRGLFYSKISYGNNPILLANIYFLLEQYSYKCIGVDPEREYTAPSSSV